MRDPVFAPLVAALRDRLAVIGDRKLYLQDPAKHLQALKQVSERIESLQADLQSPVDPQLKHYLERRSYDKALALLEDS